MRAATCAFGFLLLSAAPLAAQPPAVSPPALIASAAIEPGGAIRIAYENGSSLEIPVEKESPDLPKVLGYSNLAIAPDRRTVGWTILYENCCTSYPIPLALVLHRNGREILRLHDGLMMYEWHYWADGREVVFQADTVHGNFAPHAVRVDIATGRVIEEFTGNVSDTSPAWTRPPG